MVSKRTEEGRWPADQADRMRSRADQLRARASSSSRASASSTDGRRTSARPISPKRFSRTISIPVGGQAGTHKYLKLSILFAIWTQRSVFRHPLALRLSCRLLNLCARQPYISHEFNVHVITVMGLLTIFASKTSKLRSQPAVAARSESWEQWLHGFGDRATGDAWTEGQSPRRQCVGARAKS